MPASVKCADHRCGSLMNAVIDVRPTEMADRRRPARRNTTVAPGTAHDRCDLQPQSSGAHGALALLHDVGRNVVVIVVMLIVFALAILAPFPGTADGRRTT